MVTSRQTVPIAYSIVVPMKDEEDHVGDLLAEIEPVMNTLGHPWELICIDDGSSDGTGKRLQGLRQQHPFLTILTLAKSSGQSAALAAGFARARGEFIITLDGDRQNDPADIPKLLTAIADYDLVCGRRVTRSDPWTRKVISYLSNAIRRRVCGDGIHDTGCALKVCRRSCLRQIRLFNGMHRFLPALFQIEGFRVREIPVSHRARTAGQSKVRLGSRLFGPVFDMLGVAWMRKRRLRYHLERDIR